MEVGLDVKLLGFSAYIYSGTYSEWELLWGVLHLGYNCSPDALYVQ